MNCFAVHMRSLLRPARICRKAENHVTRAVSKKRQIGGTTFCRYKKLMLYIPQSQQEGD